MGIQDDIPEEVTVCGGGSGALSVKRNKERTSSKRRQQKCFWVKKLGFGDSEFLEILRRGRKLESRKRSYYVVVGHGFRSPFYVL